MVTREGPKFHVAVFTTMDCQRGSAEKTIAISSCVVDFQPELSPCLR